MLMICLLLSCPSQPSPTCPYGLLQVRAASIACVLACAAQLSMAEVHCILLPILRPYLQTADMVVINEVRTATT